MLAVRAEDHVLRSDFHARVPKDSVENHLLCEASPALIFDKVVGDVGEMGFVGTEDQGPGFDVGKRGAWSRVHDYDFFLSDAGRVSDMLSTLAQDE